jgi:hypothetical protein
MEVITGYQTLEDLDNIDHVEMSGPFKCIRNDAWLGYGYYLWDSDFDWAMDWGQFAYVKYGKDFIIMSCRVDLTNKCFDLFGRVNDRITLKEIVDVMIEDGIIKNFNEALLPEIIEYMKQQEVFDYNSIRAYDNYRNSTKLHFRKTKIEFMDMNQRVQICVISKKDVILRPIRVIYPE